MSSEQQQKLKQEGNALVQKQQYEQAAAIYTRALELDSTSESTAAFFSNRSLCYLKTKKLAEALQDAEKTISLRPSWHRGYQRAAAACEKLGKHEEGLKHLEKCFELDDASKSDAVIKQMKEYFELNIIRQKAPSMSEDELKQASGKLTQRGLWSIGITLLHNVLTLFPNDEQSSSNEQFEKAITIFTLAIEKDALCDAAAYMFSDRSLCYYRIGKFKEAYEDAGCCCGIKPDWAQGFWARAVAAEKIGEWQIALESYDEYLKLDPRDEAGAKKLREEAAKVVADLKKREEHMQQQRQECASFFRNMTDPNERVEKSHSLLVLRFAPLLDIELMKLVFKEPCNVRLDTPYILTQELTPTASPFHPDALKAARELFETSPDSADVTVVLFSLISSMDRDSKNNNSLKGREITRRKVDYLDYLLDVAEEQEFAAPTRLMRLALLTICRHDLSSPEQIPIRKDLVFTLFNRIDTARKVFYGEKASNKEFATGMLFAICTDHSDEPDVSPADQSPIDDFCSRDLYECIQTAISHGADPNCSTAIWYDSDSMSPFDCAISTLRSVKVVELFLRNGANVNKVSSSLEHPLHSETRLLCSPLIHAFLSCRTDIIDILIRVGAKIPTVKVPDYILKYFPPSVYPLVREDCPSSFFGNMCLGNVKKRSLLNKDYIQLWFKVMTDQKLSFLFPSPEGEGGFYTPLTVAIVNRLDVPLIKLMIKLKPELSKQMFLPARSDKQPPNFAVSPLGLLVERAIRRNTGVTTTTDDYLLSIATLLVDSGIDIKKDRAHCTFDLKNNTVMETIITGEELFKEVDVKETKSNETLRKLKEVMTKK